MSVLSFGTAAGTGRTLVTGTSPGSEPVGWTLPSFDDSAWTAPIAQTGLVWAVLLSGTQWICPATLAGNQPYGQIWLYRQTFSAPAAVSAALQLLADNIILGCWINGTLIMTQPDLVSTQTVFPPSLTLPPALLSSSSPNVLAVMVQNLLAADSGGGAAQSTSLDAQVRVDTGCTDLGQVTLSSINPITRPVVVSDAPTLSYPLWNGSSNNAPPSNWQTSGYDDSAWALCVANIYETLWSGIPGTQLIWDTANEESFNARALFRRHFSLPTDVPLSAQISYKANDNVIALYLNGILLGGDGDPPGTTDVLVTKVISVPRSALVLGGSNVLAVYGCNLDPSGTVPLGGAWVSYRLDLTYDLGPSIVQPGASSGTSARCLSLWNGSSNDAPPSGWQTTSFSDGGWGTAVTAFAPSDTPCPGSLNIWPTATPSSATEGALFRQHFTLPAGTILGATLQIDYDDSLNGAYLNGTLLPARGHAYTPNPPDPIDYTLLVAGGSNVLAIQAANNTASGQPNYASLSYVLSVTYTLDATGFFATCPSGLPPPGGFRLTHDPVPGGIPAWQHDGETFVVCTRDGRVLLEV